MRSNSIVCVLFIWIQDPETLEKWRRKIPRRDKVFSSGNYVCELHFEEHCFQNGTELSQPDGTVLFLPSKKRSLKPGSIPSIFPNCPKYLSTSVIKRKSPKKRSNIVTKKSDANNEGNINFFVFIFFLLFISLMLIQFSTSVILLESAESILNQPLFSAVSDLSKFFHVHFLIFIWKSHFSTFSYEMIFNL